MDIYNFIFCLNNSVSSARKISKQTQHYIPNSEFSIVACSPPLVVWQREYQKYWLHTPWRYLEKFLPTLGYFRHILEHHTDKTLNYNTYDFEIILTLVPVFQQQHTQLYAVTTQRYHLRAISFIMQ